MVSMRLSTRSLKTHLRLLVADNGAPPRPFELQYSHIDPFLTLQHVRTVPFAEPSADLPRVMSLYTIRSEPA